MIGFAHRGAPSTGIRENTLSAFAHALQKGATALESDVWLTADGVPVLVHDGLLRSGLRRRLIATMAKAALPTWIPALDDLYAHTGGDFELSLDVKDPAAASAVVAAATRHAVADRLWLCGSAAEVRSWRAEAGAARLVVSTTLRTGGQQRQLDESRIDEAADAGAAALNLRAPEWSAVRVRRCHGRRLLAFAWDVQHSTTLESMRTYGCDAIFSDFLTLLASA